MEDYVRTDSLDVQAMQGLILGERLCQSCDSIVVDHIATQLQMSQRRVHLFSVSTLLLTLGDRGDCTSAMVPLACRTKQQHPITLELTCSCTVMPLHMCLKR